MATTPGTPVKVTIDGRVIEVAPGTTVFDAARALRIDIPTLCHAQHQTPVGVCRVCTVEVGRNARVLTAACVRACEPGMEVETASPRVQQVRKTLYELLLTDHPGPCLRQQATGDCELETLASRAGVTRSRFAPQPPERPIDDSSPIIKVDPSACILCDRCIRACSEVKQNFVIGRMGKGGDTAIAFDADAPMGESTCVGCGECMVSCPTGALTNKGEVGAQLPGEELSPDELLRLPIFSGASGTFLALNRGSVVRRRVRAGEVICREGEHGSTAFYILSGRVQVSISTPMAHVKSHGQGGGITAFLRRLTRLASSAEDPRDPTQSQYIPIDAPVDLAYGNPVAELGPGELFGEMTCMNFYPRSATVRALEDTEVLEMLRNVLHMLQKNKRFRAELDRRYRERALQTHLASVPMFASVTPDFIRQLQDRVSLITYEPGQVICRQGDPADSFFLVRIGFVKVTQAFPGGEMVLQYLSRGSYFGEIGLLGGGAGLRTATCTALDHVELVQIRAEDFHEMMARFPDVRARLEREALLRTVSDEERHRKVSTLPIGDFLAQGLMEAQSLLLIDLERCTRCDACVHACAAAHDGVTRLVRDGLRFDKYLVATSCRSCRDPRCMVGCPVGSIRRRDSLEIVIEDWCIGCGLCAKNCPYGNINLHEFVVNAEDPDRPGKTKAVVREKATTCDLSRELHEPACVYACPHDAAKRVEPITFFADRLGMAK